MTRDVTELKRQAGEFAAEFVESGMIIGLGHGSTAIWALRKISKKLQEGTLTDIQGVPTSLQVAQEADALGIPLTNLDQHPAIDLTIDGADEVSPDFQIIKGGGGALLREKIVAQASRREIIVVDESKLSPSLGMNFALPVEVIPFGWTTQVKTLEKLGAVWERRLSDDGEPFRTDNQNFILDCKFPSIDDPHQLASQLNSLAVVVEHGLFLDLATDMVVARENGLEHLPTSNRPV